ncbi:MAG: hypothetical protein IPK75_18795 [Acidobacteria bacterium]|nr:hypothetical protein [Acidobacteriota bacterium]
MRALLQITSASAFVSMLHDVVVTAEEQRDHDRRHAKFVADATAERDRLVAAQQEREHMTEATQEIIEPSSAPQTALVVIETLTPAKAFEPGGLEKLLTRLEEEVLAIPVDISTDRGRKACASLSRKVASACIRLDELGKKLNESKRKEIGIVDAERRTMRARLESLRDRVRKPLDDFLAAEAKRVDAHEGALALIEGLTVFSEQPTAAQVKERIVSLRLLPQRDWQEFAARAEQAIQRASLCLSDELGRADAREADAAELARLRAEALERERQQAEQAAAEAQRVREEQIAERARQQAEEAAAFAIAEAERVAAEAERRAREAEEELEADRARAREMVRLAEEEASRPAPAETAVALPMTSGSYPDPVGASLVSLSVAFTPAVMKPTPALDEKRLAAAAAIVRLSGVDGITGIDLRSACCLIDAIEAGRVPHVRSPLR